MRTRARVCERPELFIGLKPVTIEGFAQAIFWGAHAPSRVVRGALAASYPDGIRHLARRILPFDWRLRQSPGCRGDRSPEAPVLEQMLMSGFRVRCDSGLERNTVIGLRRF